MPTKENRDPVLDFRSTLNDVATMPQHTSVGVIPTANNCLPMPLSELQESQKQR